MINIQFPNSEIILFLKFQFAISNFYIFKKFNVSAINFVQEKKSHLTLQMPININFTLI